MFAETSWNDRSLFGASQAGLVNNLNDGLSWGVLPVLFAAARVGLADIGLLKAGLPRRVGSRTDRHQVDGGPVRTPTADRRRHARAEPRLATIGLGTARPFAWGMVGMTLLGIGTAMAYPALLAAVGRSGGTLAMLSARSSLASSPTCCRSSPPFTPPPPSPSSPDSSPGAQSPKPDTPSTKTEGTRMMRDGMMMAPMMMVLMLIITIVVVVALIAGVVWLVRTLSDNRRPDRRSAGEELQLRYARGEIDREEYLQRRDDLEGRP